MSSESQYGSPGVRWFLVVGACTLCVLSFVGCESTGNRYVNQYNYERITAGMPMEQVRDLVGKPSRHEGDEFYYEGQYGDIKIKSKGGCVEAKEWVDKH